MKCFIICVSLLTSAPAVAQQVEQVGANLETQAMLERVDLAGQWVSSTLEKLANNMGTTVEYLWPTFVRRVFITGIVQVLSGFLILLASILLRKHLSKTRDSLNDGWQKSGRGKPGDWAAGACGVETISIGVILAGVFIAIWLTAIGTISMVAPEPEALKDIATAISQLK
jgi:hypothetical protein